MIEYLSIQGFKALKSVSAYVNRVEVLIGPNGSGKTSFFTFLKFIRDALRQVIPPEIIHGQHGESLFSNNDSIISWSIDFDLGDRVAMYVGLLSGPTGRPDAYSESIRSFDKQERHLKQDHADTELESLHGKVHLYELGDQTPTETIEKPPYQLALAYSTNQKYIHPHQIKKTISNWSFFSSFTVNGKILRRSVLLEERPALNEDCSNLSSVLHYFMTEHPEVFNEIQFHLKQLVPGFSHLTVKARGGPGEVMAFWREQGVEQDLSLADLSDGILRLLCWMALFLHPKPPTLICIDEPDLGVHPRTLPLLAALIKKASVRTQIFVTTHNSYFLSQFALENITVFRKENGATKAHKPKDSKVLVELLEEFGQGEIALMHQSEELEVL